MLRGLFYETLAQDPITNALIADDVGHRPIFTLKTYDHEIPMESIFYRHGGVNSLRSLYQIYLQAADPTEYKFAVDTFGNYEHWKALIDCEFFKEYLNEMRETLALKLDSQTVEVAKKIVERKDHPQSLQAAKWLNSLVKQKVAPKRGRPSKDEVQGELLRQVNAQKDFLEDQKRLGL